jgi:hypothetical protein
MAKHLEHRAKLRAAIIDILGDGVQSLSVIQERLGSRRIIVSTIEVRDELVRMDKADIVLKFTNRRTNRGTNPSKFFDMEVLYELMR